MGAKSPLKGNSSQTLRLTILKIMGSFLRVCLTPNQLPIQVNQLRKARNLIKLLLQSLTQWILIPLKVLASSAITFPEEKIRQAGNDAIIKHFDRASCQIILKRYKELMESAEA